MSKQGRVPALDGIRAVAVLMVIGHHTHIPGLRGGFLGVDIFFVLSGYLITRLLLEELRATSSLDLKGFYRRRFCRLTPPLILLVVAFWLLGGDFSFGLRALLYLTDVMPVDMSNPLNHTWSLAIEEQFYLLWPVALLLMRRLPAPRLIAFLAGLYILGTLWRIAAGYIMGGDVVYFRPDAHSSGILLGSLLAVVLAQKPGALAGIRAGRWAVAVGLALLPLIPVLRWPAPVEQTIGIALAEMVTALTILSIARGEPHFRWLSNSVLARIGQISYGVYLFHNPFSFVLEPLVPWWIAFPLVLGASLLAATLSYHFVEQPVMRTLGAKRVRGGEAAGLSPPTPVPIKAAVGRPA